MINKIVRSMDEAMSGIQDGSTVLIAGFGHVGQPIALIQGLVEQGARDLTIVSNSGGRGHTGPLARLFEQDRVRKIICSFLRASSLAGELVRVGKVELEVVPQGTLAERLRASGSGVQAFFTPTGAGTKVAEGKETREIGGRECVLEYALHGDVALIEAWRADRWGNAMYRATGRSYNPIMAAAAKLTIMQTQHLAELGELDSEAITTPGIYVNRVIHVPYGDPPPP
ncbi:MAG: 3-oxoacid CoA-transferase subunit A [Acetobacteraceae bacterium]|nr:3-oxoacid CoA-transferase subunit A [Acetobacteraceae bacterium]MBV8520599.1 3-oxoacid CoA-transferase subunit A [Acetobacteraceae bacterium]MBV8591075.1 3-oxoacid CoA-transferase subunit A [Acetobacteraceae bacterium]